MTLWKKKCIEATIGTMESCFFSPK